MNRVLRNVLIFFSDLRDWQQFFSFVLKTTNLVQTTATFGGLYSVIPNDIGNTESQIEAVE
jgi:hypothetical protein